MKLVVIHILSAVLIITLLFPLMGAATGLQAQQDFVILKKDPNSKQAQVVVSNGTITQADYNGIRYSSGKGSSEKITRFNPWEVEWIKYGGIGDDATTEEYNSGVQMLISEGWDKAAQIFEKMLKHEGRQRDWGPVWQIRKDNRRSMVLYSTYYYHGYALLQAGMSKQKIAQQEYQKVLKIYPIGLSGYARRKRAEDFDENPEKTEKVKKVITKAINAVQKRLKRLGASSTSADAKIEAYLKEIEETQSADKLDEIVGKFMDVCIEYFSSNFRAAVEKLNEPFKNTSLDEKALKFSQYRPLFFFKMKQAVARAYFGLREFAEGAYEIDEYLTPEKAGRNSNNPSLQTVITTLSQRNKKYYEYLIEGYIYTAQAYESEPDYRKAQNVYKQILRVLKNEKTFESYTNDAMLSVALCQAKMQRIDEANKTLDKLLEGFVIPEGVMVEEWAKKNLISKTKAALYMGVYLTMGEIYYDQYSSNDDNEYLMKSFDAYQKVTALFNADDLKKAEALYWLNRIALEIADVKYSEYKNSPATLSDNRLNPYKYYTDLATQYKTELTRHYPYTDWAVR